MTNTSYETCGVCGCKFNKDSELFEVRCGKPMSPQVFAKKVCVLRRPEVKNQCINSKFANKYSAADCSWDSANSLDPKSKATLQEIGIDSECLDELNKPWHLRNMEL